MPRPHPSRVENGAVDLKLSTLLELSRLLDQEVALVRRTALLPMRAVLREAPRGPTEDRPTYSVDDEDILGEVVPMAESWQIPMSATWPLTMIWVILVASKGNNRPMISEHPSITLDPNVLAGKPVIRGTRLSVEFVIGLMADGWGEADILANYPGIRHEDVLACLAYARETLSLERVFPSAA